MSSYIYIFSKKRKRAITSTSMVMTNLISSGRVDTSDNLLGLIVANGTASKPKYYIGKILEHVSDETVYSTRVVGNVGGATNIVVSTIASKNIRFVKTASNLIASELLLTKKLKPQTVKVDIVFAENIRKEKTTVVDASISGGIVELITDTRCAQADLSISGTNIERLMSIWSIPIKSSIQTGPVENIFYNGRSEVNGIATINDTSVDIVFSNKAIENRLSVDKISIGHTTRFISNTNGRTSTIGGLLIEQLIPNSTSNSTIAVRTVKAESINKESVSGIETSISGQCKTETISSKQNDNFSIELTTIGGEIISETKQNALQYLIQNVVSEISKVVPTITNQSSVANGVYEIVCSKLDKSLLSSLQSIDMTGLIGTRPLPTYGWLATLSRLVVEVAIIKGATYALGSISVEVASIIADVLSIVIGGISIELVEDESINSSIVLYLNSLYLEAVITEDWKSAISIQINDVNIECVLIDG